MTIVNIVMKGWDDALFVPAFSISHKIKFIYSVYFPCAILQSRSPTCGVNEVYDGSFFGKLIPGSGVFAQALRDAGYQVIDAEDV